MSIDVLMVTYNAPASTRLALSRLLESCDDTMRVWLWHNGDHAETLDVVREFARHPGVYRFHHSAENVRLWAPTNWLLQNAEGDYLSKVDDDNVLPLDWAKRLREAHRAYDRFGVLGCWRFQSEDFDPKLAAPKIQSFNGVQLLRNFWVEGSCFLMRRACRDELGPLAPGQTFPQYCKSLSLRGWVNGWLYPFVHYENLDDPRSPNTLIRTQADLERRLPLTAQYNGIRTIEGWTDQLRRSALNAQTASIDARQYQGWRRLARRAWVRTLRALGKKSRW